jgi:pSer/pThr/pTyr-binding forkhead associated (FHA) protein
MSVKQYTIGRGDECQILIQDNTQRVSRSHATLKVSGYGKMFIADHSSNGTFVNGVKIASNIDFPVKRGDTISFANAVELNWKLIPKTRNKLLLYSLIAVGVIAVGAFIFYLSSNRCMPGQEEEIALPPDSLEYVKRDSVDQNNKLQQL